MTSSPVERLGKPRRDYVCTSQLEPAVAFINEAHRLVSASHTFLQAIQAPNGLCGSATFQDWLIEQYPTARERICAAFSTTYPVELSLQPIDAAELSLSISSAGMAQRLVKVTRNTIAPQNKHAEIHTDPLTQLGNRRLLERILMDRADESSPLAMLMVDLDRFKHINDTLGHGVGDKLLELVAKRTKRTTRKDDVLIRIGGDEFIILHEAGTNSLESAQYIAARLVDMIGRPFLVDGHQLNISASVGIAILHQGTENVNDLMRHADLALYAAKDAGRSNYQVFSPSLEEKALKRRELEILLRRALNLNEFELVYQPQIDIPAGRITGFEALIRWNSKQLGLIPSEDFIPLAEETGEINTIGEWVLETACIEACRWSNDLIVAVNVSPVQITTDRFVADVKRALHKSGLPANRLEIEITENVLIDNHEQALRHLLAIHELGVSIAMDDFGTGYSSLSYLNSFPFSKIKIDRAFVSQNITMKSKALTLAIINLANNLGMKTLAEGVETTEQLAWLSEAGCISAQGYLFSRPLKAGDLNQFVLEYEQPAREIRDS